MGFREVADVFDGVDGIPPAQKLVAVALADRADQDGVSWPSVDELCRRTCQSKSSVLRHLRALEERGVLTIQTRRDRLPDGRWVQRTNVYRLNLSDIRAGVFSQVTPGCQIDTPVKETNENPQLTPECQIDTPVAPPGCQNRPYRGVTRDTRTKDQLNNHPSPQPPKGFGEGAGAAMPLGGTPDGAPGEGSDSPDLGRVVAGLSPAQRAALLAALGVEGVRSMAATRGEPQASEEALPPAGGEEAPSPDGLADVAKEVLPEPMQAVGPRDLVRLGQAIRDRLDAGWSKDQISVILAGRALPDDVRNLAALTFARLRDDVPINQPPESGRGDQLPRLVDSTGHELAHWEIDWGQVAMDHRAAQKAGLPAGNLDRREFLLEVGVDRYLLA